MFAPEEFLDLDHTAHAEIFASGRPVWAALERIAACLSAKLDAHEGPLVEGEVDERAAVGPQVYIGPGAVVEPFAVIQGPAWIGENCVVRSHAYLREDVIAGNGVVMGNSCEFKNCLIFDGCEVPHFNYVGDSILGHRAHLGAGVICSNVRLDRGTVVVRAPSGEKIDTGLAKFGAIIGDRAEIGCNSVLNPGTLLARESRVFPCSSR